MNGFGVIVQATLRAILRDRVLHALVGAALLIFLLVPAFSLFSMRQVQELAITLALSTISLSLLVLTIMLGGFAVWRDVERRYTASVLGLPVSRAGYLLGKFAAVAVFLALCAAVLTTVSAAVIVFSSGLYPSDLPLVWSNLLAAVVADVCKFTLLAAFALLFSSLSTSFFLPVFGTLAVYFAGSASQEVMEYVTGEFGQKLSAPVRALGEGLYYVLPNFSAFNLKVQAIYALPLSLPGLAFTFLYFLIYTGLLLTLAVRVFERRELP